MVRIRAITVFTQPVDWSIEGVKEAVENASIKACELLDYFGKSLGVWSTRVALPPTPPEVDPVKIALTALEVAEANGIKYVAAGHMHGGRKDLEKIIDVVESGVYASILLSRTEYIPRIASVVVKTSERDLLAATRLAVIFGGSWIQTPYFPAAAQTESSIGFGLALLYVNDLIKVIDKGESRENIKECIWSTLSKIQELALEAANATGLEFYGVDASISPWMEESVVALIEKMSRCKFGQPGTLNTIRELNQVLKSVVTAFNAIGFNEIMLPVAEDSLLKQRVAEGLVRVRDLLLYATVCVAGVDMVVVGKGVDDKWVQQLITDLHTIYKLKGFNLGLRLIIASDLEPGEWLDLGMFGKVPVAWW